MTELDLSRASVGVRLRLIEMPDHPLTTRMISMGLRAGAEVTVVAKAASGSRIVRVGDARLSVAKALCRQISVVEVANVL